MTLGEGKRKVLMLLDEYSVGGAIALNNDLSLKMNDFFDIAQKDVAAWQPIVRRTELTLDGTGCMELPEGVENVVRIRRDGIRTMRYEVLDGKLLSPVGDGSTLTLDYLAQPRSITSETGDDYVFEVGEDAANCLPLFVAAQQLLADVTVDHGAFYNLYLQMRGMLPRGAAPQYTVRQELYARRRG